MDFILNILKGFVGSVGFDSAKLKDAIWNAFARAFEIEPIIEEGTEVTFKVSDRVVGEWDGAIKAGAGEALDGPAIRKAFLTFAKILYKALYGTPESEE